MTGDKSKEHGAPGGPASAHVQPLASTVQVAVGEIVSCSAGSQASSGLRNRQAPPIGALRPSTVTLEPRTRVPLPSALAWRNIRDRIGTGSSGISAQKNHRAPPRVRIGETA